MTAAVTPKGERRRYALVSAAAELLCEGGFDAVRHRAVARRAGLPLASTTYYFSSLDDLIAKAVEHVGTREAEQLRTGCRSLSRRRRGAESTADVLVDLLVGDTPGSAGSEQLISRYERYIACARQPALRDDPAPDHDGSAPTPWSKSSSGRAARCVGTVDRAGLRRRRRGGRGAGGRRRGPAGHGQGDR